MAEQAKTPGGTAHTAEQAAAKVRSQAADAIGRVEAKAKDGADLRDIAGELKGTADEVKSAAVEGGRQFYEAAKEHATGFVDQRKNDAAQSVADIAASLRETGKGFSERPNIQNFVGTAADGLEQLATGLRERSFADIYGDVEDYARRSPATVGAVAVVAGFLLARFIKSSAEDLAEGQDAARRSREAAARRRSPARPFDA